MTDAVRLLTIFMCCANIGVLLALYQRVGRSFLPRLWMRMLMVASVVWLATTATAAYARFGQPLSWRTPFYTLAAALELASFVGLYRWYGTPAGLKHSERMKREE